MNKSLVTSKEEQDEASRVNTIESKRNLKASCTTNDPSLSIYSVHPAVIVFNAYEYESIPLDHGFPKQDQGCKNNSICTEMNKSPKKETQANPPSKCLSCIII